MSNGSRVPFVPGRRRLHPWPIRIMHWINAVAMIVMITSGWGIYDDDAIVKGFLFPGWARLGEWAAPSLNYHFAGMWLLVRELANRVHQILQRSRTWSSSWLSTISPCY